MRRNSDDNDSAGKPSVFEFSLRAAHATVFGLLMAAISITAPAQQTVFNVPTTDVLDNGKVYFELDVSAKPNDSAGSTSFHHSFRASLWAPATALRPA